MNGVRDDATVIRPAGSKVRPHCAHIGLCISRLYRGSRADRHSALSPPRDARGCERLGVDARVLGAVLRPGHGADCLTPAWLTCPEVRLAGRCATPTWSQRGLAKARVPSVVLVQGRGVPMRCTKLFRLLTISMMCLMCV